MKLTSKKIIEKRGWMYEDVQDKKIVRVQDKCDGSVISFVEFENGKVRAKSKMSFISEQAQIAQKIYDTDENIRNFITECIHKDKTPIFELVGPMNIIVLSYQKDELLLLQVRDDTGEYLTREDIDNSTKSTAVVRAEDYNIKLLEKVSSKYNIEEAKEVLKNNKFKTFDEMLQFLETKQILNNDMVKNINVN